MENFYDIKSGLKGKRDSFEELSCQIFHRELSVKSNTFQRYRGDGGDGGVEAVFINEDLSEIGLQTKYWENNSFGTSEITQLSKSLETAINNHPNLKIYYISIPFNLTGVVAEGKRGKSQTEKFKSWKNDCEAKYKTKIILWDATSLSDLLHKHDVSGGLYSYWFDSNCLSQENYIRYSKSIIAQAGKRYTPELNVQVPLYNILKYFSENDELHKDFNNINNLIYKYNKNSIFEERDGTFYNKIRDGVLKIIEQLNFLFYKNRYELITDINKILECLLQYVSEEEKKALVDLKKKYGEKFHDGPQFRQFMAEYMCEFPCALLDETREFEDDLRSIKEFINSDNIKSYFSKILVITGPAGIGKTHSIVDYIRNDKLNTDFVFFGEDFSTQEPWTVFRDKLGFPSTISKDELYQIFSANAEAKHSIGIIFIDAINESADINKWHSWLPVLINDISYYPNLKLCLSCRDTYLSEFDDDFSNFFIFEHNGFVGNEYLAINSFCNYYKILPPSYPIFNSEFGNPLFLHLLCETISNTSNKTFPKGQLGLISVFNDFIRMKNRNISRLCDIDTEENILTRIFKLISEKMLVTKKRYLLYSEFKEITSSVQPTIFFSKSLVNILEKESVIVKFKTQDEIRVRFSYDRLTDFYIAKNILSENYENYLTDETFVESNLSVIEMLSILIPENKNGIEILDFSTKSFFYESFISGLLWRKAETITDKTVFYVRKLLSHKDFFSKIMNSLLSIAITPNSRLNAYFIHNLLSENSMCNRDCFFTFYLINDYELKNSAWQLINRACFSELDNYTDDTLFLWCIILSWFCSASDRRIRDQSSKGLTRILYKSPSLCIRLYDFFSDSDDEYILERILQSVYSSLLLTRSYKDIESIANFIKSNNLLEKYDNVIIHDSLRLIVEFAYIENSNFLDVDEYKKIVSIKSNSKFEKVDEAVYNKLIQNEVFNDYNINFVGRWYTDFQRYILGNKIDIFDLKAADISNEDIYKWFVVSLHNLGYPGFDDRAFYFDNYLKGKYGNGRGKPVYIERLSKKYYWILLHKLIGLLSNSCELKSNKYEDERESTLPLLYSIPLRDIDLSDQRFNSKIIYPSIHENSTKINIEKTPIDWITDDNDFFDEQAIIFNLKDENDIEWIPLNYIQKIKTTEDETAEYPYRDTCILLSSSFISNADFDNLSETELRKLVNGNVFDNITKDYRIYLGEYTKSRSYQEYTERDYISEIEYRNDDIKIYPTSCELLRGAEWEYDCSYESINLLEPSRMIIENLNLVWDGDSGWIDEKNNLVLFSQMFKEHICLFMRKDFVKKIISTIKMKLIFRIYKEKMYVPSEGGWNSSLHNKRILMSFDGNELKYIQNFEDENDFRG
ncbi:MAG: hypothetical protein J6K96_03635 [Treponema sp.]|nr:hypothetical protein [Treponema sp.]